MDTRIVDGQGAARAAVASASTSVQRRSRTPRSRVLASLQAARLDTVARMLRTREDGGSPATLALLDAIDRAYQRMASRYLSGCYRA